MSRMLWSVPIKISWSTIITFGNSYVTHSILNVLFSKLHNLPIQNFCNPNLFHSLKSDWNCTETSTTYCDSINFPLQEPLAWIFSTRPPTPIERFPKIQHREVLCQVPPSSHVSLRIWQMNGKIYHHRAEFTRRMRDGVQCTAAHMPAKGRPYPNEGLAYVGRRMPHVNGPNLGLLLQ
jgi:hypothetical protein